jgi:hypothetical protein
LERLEPRVFLSASLGGSAAAGFSHPTVIVQSVSPSINAVPVNAMVPSQIRSAYGFDQVLFGSVVGDGSGQTVAIIDVYDYPTALDDLNHFSSQFGLPLFNVSGGPTFSQVGQTGGAVPQTDPNGAGNGTWEVEESLDIEWVHASAPQANIILVEADSASDVDLIQTAVPWAASQPGVVAVSMSFSGSEFLGETTDDGNFITPSGHAGVTFLASTGDSGQPAGYPAYSPNVVAVGGTSLTLNGPAYQGETGWGGSGGGVSLYESQPSYQQGVVTQSTTMRTAPDVSMDADPNSGVAIYDSFDYPDTPWLQVGGTSVSCPLWAGLIAVADQGRVLAGLHTLNTAGDAQSLPAIYWAVSNYHDVTSGNNGFAATAGYDLVTGLGSPAANLVQALVGATVGQPSKLAFTQQPVDSPFGTAISPVVAVGVQDQFGNTVSTDNSTVTLTLVGGTFASGQNTVTATAVNGIATFDNLVIDAVGTYCLTATDGAFGQASSQSFTVFGTAAKVVFTQQPVSTPTTTIMAPAVSVAVQDAQGNTIATDDSSVTLTLNGGTFADGTTTKTVQAEYGIATFYRIIINAVGSYTLTASDDTLTQDTSQSFTAFYQATKLGFVQQPTSTQTGAVLAPTVIVAVRDKYGHTVVSDNSTVTLTLSSGTFADGSNTATATAVNGIATFNDLVINADGNYTLIAADDTLTAATSSGFLVIAPYLSVLSINRQNLSDGHAEPPSVTYTVTFSAPVTGVGPDDFQLALSGGTSVSGPVVVSPSGGYHSVYTVTVNNISGSGTLRLNLVDNGSIADAHGNHLAGPARTFQSQQASAVGWWPTSVAAADVNGDGKADMIAANSLTDDVSVLLGNGDGTFLVQKTFDAGWDPDFVSVADVNGDGKPDLVVASFASNGTLSVLLGNGDGTFQAPDIIAVGSWPGSVAAADVNGDGKQDLVVANTGSNNVGVLLGNGDGTFQAQRTFAAGQSAGFVAVADVNGDGKADLVVANGGSDNVGVLLGNGDGTFQDQRVFSTGSNSEPLCVAVADVNRDGRLDLVVANEAGDNVGVLLGNGDGSFQAQRTFAVGSNPIFVAAADINGDGNADLAVANGGGDNVGVLLGNGDGTFGVQKAFGTGTMPVSLAVADVNGDGTPDILGACEVGSTVSVLLSSENFISQPYAIAAPNGLKVWLDADPVGGGQYSVRIWAQALHCSPGDGIASATITIYTPDSVGLTVPKETGLAAKHVVTTWNPLILGNFLTAAAVPRDIDFDGDNDASGMEFYGVSYTLPDLGVQPVLVATETWTMTADQATLLAVSIANAQHWDSQSGQKVAFDYVVGLGQVVPPWPQGDLNHDNTVNAQDIDLLYANFGGNARYDLNADGLVNQADVDYLVKNVLHTNYGDANLDGKVDFADFQVLLDHWQNSGAGWAKGDFTGDGKVDFSDFQKLLDDWNPAGFGAGLPNDGAGMTSATGAADAAPQVAISMAGVSAVAAPWTDLFASAIPAGLADPGRMCKPLRPLGRPAHGIPVPEAASNIPFASRGRLAHLTGMRHSAGSAQIADADTVDLLTQLHSRFVKIGD